MYIYPENLKGKSTMFLWTLRDMLIIIIGAVLSAVFAAALDWIVPGVLIGVFAFLTLRIDNELNISDYIRFAFDKNENWKEEIYQRRNRRQKY